MNSVQLVGRLATEIDLKEVTGGSKVSSFILAVDRNAEEADLPIMQTAEPRVARLCHTIQTPRWAPWDCVV